MSKTDVRERPVYHLAEAARFLKLPVTTLRPWVVGRAYPLVSRRNDFKPLLRPALVEPVTLSFWNLVEAHVIRSLRQEHSVALGALRQAIEYAETAMGIDRLLLSKELRADAGALFLERYGDLIHLSASGQLAMRAIFKAHLDRVVWDEWKFPIRLYPFVSSTMNGTEKPIAIDPKIAFGRPTVVSKSISTAAIAARIDAGETSKELEEDYDISAEEISQAAIYERVA
jgi:uncharacterized protein (DUF433 family)